ncbi:hypothetical protein BN2475_130074 [Paraburkholderia ribeironis]|uniref:Uncharacterized protein n=1 Tax=Paraburkholderia ribeironis TaxID=1247936 RepID=A0A1N7RSH4_9BURK|nr:hypothetical protein BN2475_130074 [Paraburkholderia ribeironis]
MRLFVSILYNAVREGIAFALSRQSTEMLDGIGFHVADWSFGTVFSELNRAPHAHRNALSAMCRN